MLLDTAQKINLETEDFQLKKAHFFAYISELAYVKFENDRKLLSVPLNERGLELIEIFNHPVSKTQGYLAKSKNFAVLCFRGTESDYIDIITDLKAMLKDGGHEGFFSAYESIHNAVEVALEKVSGLPLYVTGHSLGGALAKVFVINHGHDRVRACYTYGSPAICTEDKTSNNLVPVFLVVNSGDVVPRSLSLGPLAAVLFKWLLKIIRWVCHRVICIKTPNLDEWLKVVKILETDTQKYTHFGTIHYLDESGTISVLKCAKESLQLFFQILTKDFNKSFEDHSIGKYITKLEKISKESV